MDTVVDEWCWAGLHRRLLHRVDRVPLTVTRQGIRYWFARCGSLVLPATGAELHDRQHCPNCDQGTYFRFPSKEGHRPHETALRCARRSAR